MIEEAFPSHVGSIRSVPPSQSIYPGRMCFHPMLVRLEVREQIALIHFLPSFPSHVGSIRSSIEPSGISFRLDVSIPCWFD
jgi:hypothetical protein